MFRGLGGSKRRLAKGAEPFGRVRDQKLHAAMAQSTFRSPNVKAPQVRRIFGSWAVEKCTRPWHEPHFEVKMLEAHLLTTFGLTVFVVAGPKDSLPRQNWAKREGFVAVSKTMAGVGCLKSICKDSLRVAGAVQETSPSDMLGPLGGQGTDFLRGVAF